MSEPRRSQAHADAASSVPDEAAGQVLLAGPQTSAGRRQGRLLALLVVAAVLLVLVVAQRSLLAGSVRALDSLQ